MGSTTTTTIGICLMLGCSGLDGETGPMKLALVTRRYPPLIGGAEKVLSYLAAGLAAEGADVTVLTSRQPGLELPDRKQVPVELEPMGVNSGSKPHGSLTIERLPTWRLRVLGTWRYMRSLENWFRWNRIDLAYVSMLKHDAYATLRAGRRGRFPVVLRPEGAGATGDVAWQSWGNFGRRIGRRCRHADAFVTISKAIENELRESWKNGTLRPSGFDEMIRPSPPVPRLTPIPNGVPIPAMAWQRRADWRSAPRAIFVGRLAAEKGLDILIDAWPKVRMHHPGACLTLVGEGPERTDLESRAVSLGLTPGVEIAFPGVAADVTAALRNADLFVLPSREEGMSIALLEAMALGIPLVASAIPGNRRIVSDFKHGRLAPAGDPSGLARVISEQWDNVDRAFHMSRAARHRVEQEFSIRAVARQHLKLFESLVGSKRETQQS
jgi:glycosyltransferase involved in cell wall biosynthesis